MMVRDSATFWLANQSDVICNQSDVIWKASVGGVTPNTPQQEAIPNV
jgi:hypothetical protein